VSVEHQATHIVTLADATQWLAEHGLNIEHTQEAVIRIDGSGPDHHSTCAWLDATFYKLDGRGELYSDSATGDAATGHATIPLASFPRLTPVPPREDEP
jgi:hypothetical protein